MDRIAQWLQEWGGAVALALFAAWVLRTLRKMGTASGSASAEPESDPFDAPQLKLRTAAALEAPHEDQPREPTRRDLIQTVVKDNPEMTAAVIGRWLQQAAK
jgi:flagellar biosynthesis/type III secretory pathway M-ring protein FliF/YscJ